MTKLNQIIAIEAGAKEQATAAIVTAQTLLRSDLSAFAGLAKQHELHEGFTDQPRRPDERVKVKVVAEDVLSRLADDLVRLFDVTLTKEVADAGATADVVVTRDGKQHVLVKAAPVTYLLFLEKQLARLEQRIINAQLPLQDPATVWEPDGNTGLYRTEQYQTPTTTRKRSNWVKAEATQYHPAQVEVYEDDLITGHWNTVRYTGALPQARVRQLMERLAELKRAVIIAREEANSAPVTDFRAGNAIFDWLLA